MIDTLDHLLAGAVAMTSLIASLFFLRFWRDTRDSFFILFATAFALDAATRCVLGLFPISDEAAPLFYLARLVTFALIIIAIVQKNRPGKRTR